MSVPDRIACMLMRGGTSKGAYFLAEDLPLERATRDDVLLRVMGSPDPRQIDGIGGAHPLTSKVAIVSSSEEDDVDVDYLFLQIGIDQPRVSDAQTCGNLLAGVGPFAVERGLVAPESDRTKVRIRMRNTGDLAVATFSTPNGRPQYDGITAIDGVPGTSAAIELEMVESARSLLPTGNPVDLIDGVSVTLIDNGMPVVIISASDMGCTGGESPEELEANSELRTRIERIRLQAGLLMNLGDVADLTVPKMFMVAEPTRGGAIRTRGFIPHRVHTSIGVMMAASVAASVRLPGSVAHELAGAQRFDDDTVLIEHPSGVFASKVHVRRGVDDVWRATSASVRTARALFDGWVFPRPAA